MKKTTTTGGKKSNKREYANAVKTGQKYVHNLTLKHLGSKINCMICGYRTLKLPVDYYIDMNALLNEIGKYPIDGGCLVMIRPGYGSRHDMDWYLGAVCDDCIDVKKAFNQLNKQGKTVLIDLKEAHKNLHKDLHQY